MEAINEDVFDLDELEEEELVDNEAVDAVDGSPSASIASSTFLSAIREVSFPAYSTLRGNSGFGVIINLKIIFLM